jgi:hypothetical protein
MAVPKSFTTFDIDKSTLALWLFRRTPQPGGPPQYTGRWIDTHEELDEALKEAVTTERERISEVQDYSLLAQNNEGSALTIDALETHAGRIQAEAAAEVPARKVKDMKHIRNTDFYVVKLSKGDKVLYAVRKTESSWQTKKMKDAIYAFFSNNKLGLDDKPSFRISRLIDFFIVGGQILISHKGHFESILSYKQAHIEDFKTLQKDQAFRALFSTLDPFVSFVGTNKIHLRRACAIHGKAHYKDKAFMSRLRKDHMKYQLKLEFDSHGRIVPTEATCADIIRALLDHRLLSPFSEQVYDVPDATVVAP